MYHTSRTRSLAAFILIRVTSDWHFTYDEKCYPSAAIWDGVKTAPGKEHAGEHGQSWVEGCAYQDSSDRAHEFPTYYRVRYCDYGDYQEYHVMYNVFFPYVS
jgi:hypothetical protein